MQTSEVLNLAADEIQVRGWEQGDGWDYPEKSHQRLCIEGGIQVALGIEGIEGGHLERVWHCPAAVAVKRYLGTHSLFCWNDREGRTAEEVIGVLRATALIEEARERQPEPIEAAS